MYRSFCPGEDLQPWHWHRSHCSPDCESFRGSNREEDSLWDRRQVDCDHISSIDVIEWMNNDAKRLFRASIWSYLYFTKQTVNMKTSLIAIIMNFLIWQSMIFPGILSMTYHVLSFQASWRCGKLLCIFHSCRKRTRLQSWEILDRYV